MATRVRWLGHACLLVESDGRRLLVDPFLTGNPAAAVKADEVPADFILVSHGHGDHVGDTYTMGPDDALRAVKLIQPKKVLPIHYNTFDLIAQDAAAWADRVRKETKAEPVVLKPGEWMTV